MTTDPNMISENEYIGLSPLTLTDVRNFFDTYIKPFAPYENEKVYNTLINNLTEYYYNQTYFNIPSELKQLFEEVNFDTLSIYNKLLIAIGVPEEIINKISFSDKIIFLKTLSDFERYKGTISFFKKVSEAFSDRLSVYELFIDLEGANWVFKPVKIYLHEDMEVNITSIPYETIRSSIPSLLLSEEQLTNLYEEEQLILPIKSNLLLLDNDLSNNISILYDVIVSIFLHTYKENYIDLYFKDNARGIQLKTIYFLWFYLLTTYFEIPWTSFASQHLLRFAYDKIEFPTFIGTIPTSIDNLSRIINRYDEIGIVNSSTRDYDNSQGLRDSFFEDISKAFYTHAGASTTTPTDMYNELVIMNIGLISYIDDRIVNSAIGKKAEINLIMTEIYSSLVLYTSTYSGDEYFNQYVDYFLKYLPQIVINPENTTSYTILYNLKPYRVELYSTHTIGIRCEDKFNQVYIDDEKETSFLYNMMLTSVLNFSDNFSTQYNKEVISDVICVDDSTHTVGIRCEDEFNQVDDEKETNFSYNMALTSVLNFSDNFSTQYNKEVVSDVICVDDFKITLT